jgi:hypothetical protein
LRISTYKKRQSLLLPTTISESVSPARLDNSLVWSVNQRAKDFLANLKWDVPIGVVSVAGLYRTGKSYLLNSIILQRPNGFVVGDTTQACTQGLWIWTEALQGSTADGRELQLLIIDTEGLGDTEKDQDNDVRIFSLAILMSSCFVYNSKGAID